MPRSLLLSENSREKIYKGISHMCDRGYALGRIAPCRERVECRAVLALEEDTTAEQLCKCLEFCNSVGVILPITAASPRMLELIMGRGVGYIILREALPPRYFGRVALLDSVGDRVIIDPDVDTLGLCSKQVGMLTGEDRQLKDIIYENSGGDILLQGDGIGASELWEGLCLMTEECCTREFTLSLRVPSDMEERESFGESVEALFRAAVYGRASLQLEGYRDSEDIRQALCIVHRTFCRLEAEGREFNGYLRRGLLIDAPVWLFCPMSLKGVDFLTLDADRLVASLLGCTEGELRGRQRQCKDVLELIDRYLVQQSLHSSVRIRVGELAGLSAFDEWLGKRDRRWVYSRGERS